MIERQRDKEPLLQGFTLIELSIVLVIIGLIAGGVLVGRDLISSAAVRSQVSQIERFQQAANTFRGKYGYLPGDIPDPDASRFGFVARGSGAGQGDGNSVIQGSFFWDGGSEVPDQNLATGTYPSLGENGMFWRDMAQAKLVNGSFTQASPTTVNSSSVTGTGIASYLPSATAGASGYVYVWSGGWQGIYGSSSDNKNYFAVAGLTALSPTSSGSWSGGSGGATEFALFTVSQAYAIDKKADDGLPQTGRILAITGYGWWAGGGVYSGDMHSAMDSLYGGSVTSAGDIDNAETPSEYTCYDGSLGLPERYSVTRNNGNGMNCSVSIKMQ